MMFSNVPIGERNSKFGPLGLHSCPAMLSPGWNFDGNRPASQELARRPVLKAYAKREDTMSVHKTLLRLSCSLLFGAMAAGGAIRKPNQLHKAKHRH